MMKQRGVIMKIVIAMDSFKESMSAIEAVQSVERGIHGYCRDIETILCPVADGGEGTLETIIETCHGSIEYYEVTGPLFQKIKAPIGYIENSAIIECAKVCGLELLDEMQKNPHYTTTQGLGELILIAVKHGAKKIKICLGGSATNDGGIGMLMALGICFLDKNHQCVIGTMKGLKDIETMDISSFTCLLRDIEVTAICDVDNPLCGEKGATYVYGPQKGVHNVKEIDEHMKHYGEIVDSYFQKDVMHQAGAGAAGGLGFALMSFLGAKFQSGFIEVAKMISLKEKIETCDLVIVGEGKIDKQTQYGKTPYGVLQIAKTYDKKVVAFAGKVEDLEILKSLGFNLIYQISPDNLPLDKALKQGKTNLQQSVYTHMEDIIYGL